MRPLAMTAACIASSLGLGLETTLAAVRRGVSGLQPCRFETVDLPTYVGEVDGLDLWRLDYSLIRFDCRNNRLARLALAQDGFEAAIETAKDRYGPTRIGVFLGTSTAGILQTEQAYRHRDEAGRLSYPIDYAATQSTFSIAEFVLSLLGISGPSLVISSACASTTKVFATAARMIETGLCDAAIVGGADSLCLTTFMVSIHSSCWRRNPAVRSMPTATDYRSGRPPGSPCWSDRNGRRATTSRCWALARAVTRITCRRHARTAPAR